MPKDYINDYDATAGNNGDIGGISIIEGCPPSNINDAIREGMSHLAAWKSEFEVGADIASASALPVNVPGQFHDVTGTTTITSFAEATNDTSRIKILQFDGILTLTHHATDLVLLTGANRTTAAGDIGIYYQYAAGDWREVYFSNSGVVDDLTPQLGGDLDGQGNEINSVSGVFIDEAAAAAADVAGDGQFWVKDDTPNTPMFTDDEGNDFYLISPLLHVQDQKTSGTLGGTFTSGAWRTRDLNTELTNEITGGGLVYDLPYDAETTGFTTIGQVITGGTSGATGTLVSVTDAGSTGSLFLINITGTFQDNETITGATEGSATTNTASPDDSGTGCDYANQIYLPAGTFYIESTSAYHDVNQNKAKIYNISDSSDALIGMAEYGSASYNAAGKAIISGRITLASGKVIELQHRGNTTRASDGFGIPNYFSVVEIFSDLKVWQVN